MNKTLWVYDSYNNWCNSILAAGSRRGWLVRIFSQPEQVTSGGYVFIRPQMDPKILCKEKEWLPQLLARSDLTFITDENQCMMYEDKIAQACAFGDLLPCTEVFSEASEAEAFLSRNTSWPIVSKAAVGASSEFVRILKTPDEARKEIEAVFYGAGIVLNPRRWANQQDYLLWQEFMPNNPCTLRVNVIGEQFAVFQRFNYPDKPVAQTGNTKPVTAMTPDLEALLRYSKDVARSIMTKWCALDIVRDKTGNFTLLETSLAWPWPGVGADALFWRFAEGNVVPAKRTWPDMWDVMFDEIEKGVFDA